MSLLELKTGWASTCRAPPQSKGQLLGQPAAGGVEIVGPEVYINSVPCLYVYVEAFGYLRGVATSKLTFVLSLAE
jgi:hypothetical protein